MNYVKDKNFKFVLNDLKVTEQFLIWSEFGFKGEIKSPATNQPIKFPVKEGDFLTGTDGKQRAVTELKFMKATEFKVLYPNMAKQTSFQYNVVIDGALFIANFPKTVHEKIQMFLKIPNFDWKNTVFQKSYNANLAPAYKNDITILATAPATTSVPQQITGEPQSIYQQLGMNDRESQVYAEVAKMPIKLDETQFVSLLKNNGITEDRAKILYNLGYSKK